MNTKFGLTKNISTSQSANSIVKKGSALDRATGFDSGDFLGIHDTILSADTMKMMNEIRTLEKNTALVSEQVHSGETGLEEQLFDARAQVKILFSQVSMHFNKELRSKLFHQIDLLHDIDDWEEGDESVTSQSFSTFLRWFYLSQPTQLPSFGLSSTGHLIASWIANANKDILVLEFMQNDNIKWFATKYFDGEAEHSNGIAKLMRVESVLSPYQTDDWFS